MKVIDMTYILGTLPWPYSACRHLIIGYALALSFIPFVYKGMPHLFLFFIFYFYFCQENETPMPVILR